ncbi:putative serine/threonine-protein kinase [Hibiscus syriacus]|uniref:Serine/threonine-protein kinase n=1 Tax=Hibiscus syriacus TaxID=106335 RepID=A0A6A3C6N6_HIBSY|nr:probable serine/threonine-protein kinase At1g09600 [Hibiscus syriacus]XP_039059719.1 probable serine/threonine-protein kinase At1g09600 [Hibiscus syriacus]KAE8724793.1 putative serine/threonine-protein kinase [Hibiscus syriacus]
MGCICSKGARANDYVENNHGKRDKAHKNSRKTAKKRSVSFERDNGVVETDATARLISDQQPNNSAVSGPSPSSYDEEKKAASSVVERSPSQLQTRSTMEAEAMGGQGQPRISRIVNATGGQRGAQVVAGWPSWLAAVAGEAINGWIPRKAESFEKLEKIGQGTYSSVYKARDLESNKLVALKKVRFVNVDPGSVCFMAREIIILRRLDHPNVMKLEGLITSRASGSLYLIFEYMEHDLAGLLAAPEVKFTESQIKCYMQQLLQGLNHCHSHGVLHRDIKGSNLLIDCNGNLKIGDFGLATFFHPNQKQPLTSRVVTLWYRPPELLLGSINYGVAVDLWSSGCILAELFAGKPIMPGRTEVEQLHKIFKLCGSPSEEYWKRSKLPHATIFKPQQPYKRCVPEKFKDFPASALVLLEVLLAIEPECRGTASSALQSEFFTAQPLPCDPSSLPKYPPSKEFDVKLREEESRRQRASGGKVHARDPVRRVSRESIAVPAPDINAELQTSIQKRRGQFNGKSVSEVCYSQEGRGAAFPIEPSKEAERVLYNSHSGRSMQPSRFGSSRNKKTNEIESMKALAQGFGSPRKLEELRSETLHVHRATLELSRFSNSIAVRGSSRFDMTKENNINPHWPEEHFNAGYNLLGNAESSEKHELSRHLLNRPKGSNVKDEQPSSKESAAVGYVSMNNQIHYSGPLLPRGGNLEEMLKEHERQIQNAFRKARSDKTKLRTNLDHNGQTESLL